MTLEIKKQLTTIFELLLDNLKELDHKNVDKDSIQLSLNYQIKSKPKVIGRQPTRFDIKENIEAIADTFCYRCTKDGCRRC